MLQGPFNVLTACLQSSDAISDAEAPLQLPSPASGPQWLSRTKKDSVTSWENRRKVAGGGRSGGPRWVTWTNCMKFVVKLASMLLRQSILFNHTHLTTSSIERTRLTMLKGSSFEKHAGSEVSYIKATFTRACLTIISRKTPRQAPTVILLSQSVMPQIAQQESGLSGDAHFSFCSVLEQVVLVRAMYMHSCHRALPIEANLSCTFICLQVTSYNYHYTTAKTFKSWCSWQDNRYADVQRFFQRRLQHLYKSNRKATSEGSLR